MRIAEAEGREPATRVLKTDDFDVHETIMEMAWTCAWCLQAPSALSTREDARRGRSEALCRCPRCAFTRNIRRIASASFERSEDWEAEAEGRYVAGGNSFLRRGARRRRRGLDFDVQVVVVEGVVRYLGVKFRRADGSPPS